MRQLHVQSLNLASWTLLVSQEVPQYKIYDCTGVKLRLFRIYIESLTMSQEPPKKKSKRDNGLLFVQRMHTRGCHVFCASMHQRVPYGKT